jgi:hypothetical protein
MSADQSLRTPRRASRDGGDVGQHIAAVYDIHGLKVAKSPIPQVGFAPNLGHRAIAVPDLEVAIRVCASIG